MSYESPTKQERASFPQRPCRDPKCKAKAGHPASATVAGFRTRAPNTLTGFCDACFRSYSKATQDSTLKAADKVAKVAYRTKDPVAYLKSKDARFQGAHSDTPKAKAKATPKAKASKASKASPKPKASKPKASPKAKAKASPKASPTVAAEVAKVTVPVPATEQTTPT